MDETGRDEARQDKTRRAPSRWLRGGGVYLSGSCGRRAGHFVKAPPSERRQMSSRAEPTSQRAGERTNELLISLNPVGERIKRLLIDWS